MPNRKYPRGAGFSLIELLIVVAIILIILTMALPKLDAARRTTAELSAIKSISTLQTAQAQYYSRFGRYAASLAELGPGKLGAANLISGDLALGQKAGYRFELEARQDGYTIHANPVTVHGADSRTFFSDESLTIRQNFGAEPATPESPEIK